MQFNDPGLQLMQFNDPASTKMKTNQLLKSALTHLLLGLLAAGALLATALSANAGIVNFALGADDYGSLAIGGVTLCIYDNISATGGCNSSFDMQPGVWYDIAIDYKNRAGANGMSLSHGISRDQRA